MLGRILVFIALGLAAALAQAGAQARRLALVIGNDAYRDNGPLSTAVNDAHAVAEALSKLGFDAASGNNLSHHDMAAKIEQFIATLVNGDTTCVFFAGIGFERGGKTYLLGVDAPPFGADNRAAAAVTDSAIALDGLLDRILQRGAKPAIFLINSSRNDPFASSGARGTPGPGTLTPAATTDGSFVLYAAGAGQTVKERLSPDDKSDNSVFARVLLKHLATPGQSLSELARRVQAGVRTMTAGAGKAQSPAYYDEINGEFFLVPAK